MERYNLCRHKNGMHHRSIIRRFLGSVPEATVSSAYAYCSWSDVPQMPLAGPDILIFVDGGILSGTLDVGCAMVVNDGGIIESPLYCGRLYRDGGLTEAIVIQRMVHV